MVLNNMPQYFYLYNYSPPLCSCMTLITIELVVIKGAGKGLNYLTVAGTGAYVISLL